MILKSITFSTILCVGGFGGINSVWTKFNERRCLVRRWLWAAQLPRFVEINIFPCNANYIAIKCRRVILFKVKICVGDELLSGLRNIIGFNFVNLITNDANSISSFFFLRKKGVYTDISLPIFSEWIDEMLVVENFTQYFIDKEAAEAAATLSTLETTSNTTTPTDNTNSTAIDSNNGAGVVAINTHSLIMVSMCGVLCAMKFR